MGNEEYLKGRKAGVDGTYGAKRKGLAEKTNLPHPSSHDSGGNVPVHEAATSLYDRAKAKEWDTSGIGDQALTER
jgi:hypothetical protein